MRQQVRAIIDGTLNALRADGTLRFDIVPQYSVEVPKVAEHGDWSCNVAMVLTKATGRRPDDIARVLAAALRDPDGVVATVDVAKPGFLNFRLRDRVFQQVAREVLVQGEGFGRRAARSAGGRVLVEFVSANPTGPVHIGHARGAFMGDAISRLLEAAGREVTREFYTNDHGKQVETLGRTIHKRYRQLFGESIELGEGEYPAPYVVDIARTWKAEVGDRYLRAEESEYLEPAMAIGIRENLRAIRETLFRAGIRHDEFFSEASLHRDGSVHRIVDVYREKGVTYVAPEAHRNEAKVRSDDSKAAHYGDQQRGGTFLKTSLYQDDEDRIILRQDGTPVYLTADLAYHKAKFERGFDLLVDVLGADHAGHVPRIRSGMKLLGFDDTRLKFAVVQIVRITRGGEEVKVSKRKGTVFELADLLDEAGPDVCRFLFLSRTRDAQFDFDLELVKQQSKENPVFYFQYGHARCAAILRKASEKGVPFVGVDRLTDAQLGHLVLPEEKSMLKKMSQLPDVVAGAADRLEPHHVLYFCQELIGDFHSYYTKYRGDPIISADVEKTQGRLALVAALKHTIASAFGILGIHAPESMDAPDEE
jgi:arginyl-tRNA synthetase